MFLDVKIPYQKYISALRVISLRWAVYWCTGG